VRFDEVTDLTKKSASGKLRLQSSGMLHCCAKDMSCSQEPM